jgi:hypothetical protein
MCVVKIVSLFVACLSVFILIWRGFKENGFCQENKQMAGSLILDPLAKLSFGFCTRSVLALLQMVDAIIGKVISSMVIVLAFKVHCNT